MRTIKRQYLTGLVLLLAFGVFGQEMLILEEMEPVQAESTEAVEPAITDTPVQDESAITESAVTDTPVQSELLPQETELVPIEDIAVPVETTEKAGDTYRKIIGEKLWQENYTYLLNICKQFEVPSEMALALLVADNEQNNGNVLVYQLHPYFLKADYLWRFWDKKLTYDNTQFEDNAYIAVKLMRYLLRNSDSMDTAIIAYQFGITRHVEKKPYPTQATDYLLRVKTYINRMNE